MSELTISDLVVPCDEHGMLLPHCPKRLTRHESSCRDRDIPPFDHREPRCLGGRPPSRAELIGMLNIDYEAAWDTLSRKRYLLYPEVAGNSAIARKVVDAALGDGP